MGVNQTPPAPPPQPHGTRGAQRGQHRPPAPPPLLPHMQRMWWGHVAPRSPQDVATEPPLLSVPPPQAPPGPSPSPHQQQHGLDLLEGAQAPQEAHQHRQHADPREGIGPDPQAVQRRPWGGTEVRAPHGSGGHPTAEGGTPRLGGPLPSTAAKLCLSKRTQRPKARRRLPRAWGGPGGSRPRSESGGTPGLGGLWGLPGPMAPTGARRLLAPNQSPPQSRDGAPSRPLHPCPPQAPCTHPCPPCTPCPPSVPCVPTSPLYFHVPPSPVSPPGPPIPHVPTCPPRYPHVPPVALCALRTPRPPSPMSPPSPHVPPSPMSPHVPPQPPAPLTKKKRLKRKRKHLAKPRQFLGFMSAPGGDTRGQRPPAARCGPFGGGAKRPRPVPVPSSPRPPAYLRRRLPGAAPSPAPCRGGGSSAGRVPRGAAPGTGGSAPPPRPDTPPDGTPIARPGGRWGRCTGETLSRVLGAPLADGGGGAGRGVLGAMPLGGGTRRTPGRGGLHFGGSAGRGGCRAGGGAVGLVGGVLV